MDLFTYLMAKNGNNSSVHGDLFSYLLGKGQSQIYTVSGTTIYIPNAKKLVSFMMTKESTQATSILPSEYTQVDYIESSGTQYIDTGVLYSYGTRQFDLKAQFTNINTGILISQQGDFNSSYIGNINGYWTCGDVSSSQLPITDTTLLSLKYTYTDDDTNPQLANIKYNNSNFNFARTSRFTADLNKTIYLFRGNGAVYKSAYAKLYYLKIYENDILVRDFVPCYRNSDNEVGLYDLVNDVFYTNQGTGAFTYGSVAQLPNPDYPQEVKTVKGYSNLFDKDNVTWKRNNNSTFDTGNTNTNSTRIRTSSFEIKGGKTYILSGVPQDISLSAIRTYNEEKVAGSTSVQRDGQVFTLSDDVAYIHLLFSGSNFTDETNTLMANANIQIVEGDQELPYVPYGNNYIAVNVSDGTNTNNYPIPLNNNEIVGIGDYKDELLVDKSGNVSIEKNTAKIDSYNGETITTTYMSTTGGLDTGATVYYGIDTPELIDLQTTVDLSLFKGVNNVSNSENGYMTIEYR